MRTPVMIAAVLFSLTLNTSAEALPALGMGDFSCGTWLRGREEQNERQSGLVLQWVWGFLAAHDYYRPGNTSIKPVGERGPDQATILTSLDKCCRKSPQTPLIACTAELAEELGGSAAHHNKDHR